MKEVNVPDGWVPVADYNEHRGEGGAKGEYAMLLSALEKHAIDYMSVGRPFRYYVRREEAESFLREHSPSRKSGDSNSELLSLRVAALEQQVAGQHQYLEMILDHLKTASQPHTTP